LADPNLGGKKFFPSIKSDPGQKPIGWLPVTLAGFLSTGENVRQGLERGDAWVNFYGPPGTIPGISYFLATLPDGPPLGFFSNKVVFVGAKMSADFSGKGKDEFEVPYSRWGRGLAPGVEIHATAARNIIHEEWLRRMALWAELIFILGVAAFAGFILIELNPLKATAAAIGAFLLLIITGCALAWKQQVWFAWGIGGAQIAAGLFCSILFNSILLYVDKCLLEESLAARVSPRLVKRLMNDATLRRPGGTQQEISILFTDIANFARLSETMNPDDLVQLMNKYFSVALQCVYESEGTVVKLLGDAIFAIWNAPVEQADHRERACRTAMRLRESLANFRDAHHTLPLRTRVGLHSGSACVGNIGSAQRFDYTAIGDNVNLTARLEGLNKQLGTDVLATREVQRVSEQTMVWRPVGHFKFKGIGRLVEVYELIGPSELEAATNPWRQKFAEALHKFRQRHFEAATTLFRETIALRTQGKSADGAGDGPSQFYLEKVEELTLNPPAYEWIGEIELHEK
jgi:adenylate cyclase